MRTQSFLISARAGMAMTGLLLAAWLIGPGCRGKAQVPDGPPEIVLEAAWDAVKLANWARAEACFDHVLSASDANDVHKSRSAYGLGYVWQFRKPDNDLDTAMDYYRQCVQNYPPSDMTPLAMMSLARQADLPPREKDRNAEEARQWYRRIIDEFPRSVTADEATMWLANGFLRNDDPNDLARGAEILTSYLDRRPDNFCASTMHFLLAKMHQQREEWAKAIEHYTAADEAGIAIRTERAGMCFQAAQVCEQRLNDKKDAVRWFRIIVDEVARTNKFYVAKLSLIRLLTELGDEAADRGNYPEALDYYQQALGYKPEIEALPEAKYKVALMAERTEDYKLAHRLYSEIAEKYPTYKRRAQVQEALDRIRGRLQEGE
ncbi:MAG: tetratricopeptide repeat protein [Phycisphaerae bacterium]